MPRLARLDAPGVLHHIMIRGIERRDIFKDDKDRDNLLDRLATLLPETKTACYAWVFMPNHAHFLFRTGLVPLATVMRRLLTGYAVSFNNRHKRYGQLFQNRYKSIVCQEDVYFAELVRYIHLNPLRTGIVPNLTELNSYPYCSHSSLMGKIKRRWCDVGYVLSSFGKTVHDARKAYFDFMEAGIDQGRREDLIGGGLIRSLGGWSEVGKRRLHGGAHLKSDERILGDSEFVDSIFLQADEHYARQYELKLRGYNLNRIAEKVARIYGMEPKDVLSKGRQRQKVKARSLLCFWAVRKLGMPLTALARRLDMSPPGVGYAVERGEAIAEDNNYELAD